MKGDVEPVELSLLDSEPVACSVAANGCLYAINLHQESANEVNSFKYIYTPSANEPDKSASLSKDDGGSWHC